MKRCNVCANDKKLSEFGVDRSTPDGHRYGCKECLNKRARKRATKKATKAINAKKAASRKAYYESPVGVASSRRAHLKKKYNITLEEYNEMADAQDNKCAICKKEESSKRHNVLCVDHDHDTGAIRALLCSNCNRALGLFKDQSKLLIKAAKYLEKYGK